MLSENSNQEKQPTKQQTQQKKQERTQQDKQEKRNANCDGKDVTESITQEEQLSIENLCRLLYALYREQQQKHI